MRHLQGPGLDKKHFLKGSLAAGGRGERAYFEGRKRDGKISFSSGSVVFRSGYGSIEDGFSCGAGGRGDGGSSGNRALGVLSSMMLSLKLLLLHCVFDNVGHGAVENSVG